jgi:hypothetical protein
MTTSTHRTNVAATCPACGNGASAATTETGAKPDAGDIAVCAYCSRVNLYEADLSLRAATQAELDSFPPSMRVMIARYAGIALLVRTMTKKESDDK